MLTQAASRPHGGVNNARDLCDLLEADVQIGLRLLGPALVLLAAGHSLFKPALHALAGALYRDDDPSRDSSFLLL